MRAPLLRRGIVVGSLLCACGGVPCRSDPQAKTAGLGVEQTTTPAPVFDARAAWNEFEETLRGSYAYVDRKDFSVEAQLARSRQLALQASDAEAFRALLHRTSFAFTDPHFLVGPLKDSDPNVVPTSADLVVDVRGGDFVVADVRDGSPADNARVRPGWKLMSTDGQSVEQAIERVWGGVVVARTDKQRAYAATLAANGRRTGTRTLEFEAGGVSRTITLENPRAFAKRVDERPPLSIDTWDPLESTCRHASLSIL